MEPIRKPIKPLSNKKIGGFDKKPSFSNSDVTRGNRSVGGRSSNYVTGKSKIRVKRKGFK